MYNKIEEGEMLFAKGKYEEAENCFLSVIKKDSNNKEAHNNIGVVAYLQNDLEKAVDCFKRSLKSDPFYKDAILNFTDLLREWDLSLNSIPYLEKIARINPDLN